MPLGGIEVAEEVAQCGPVAEHEHGAHTETAEYARELMAHLHACKAEQQEHEEGYAEYED